MLGMLGGAPAGGLHRLHRHQRPAPVQYLPPDGAVGLEVHVVQGLGLGLRLALGHVDRGFGWYETWLKRKSGRVLGVGRGWVVDETLLASWLVEGPTPSR